MYQHSNVVHRMKNCNTRAIIPTQVDIDLTNICHQDCFNCNLVEHQRASPVQEG